MRDLAPSNSRVSFYRISDFVPYRTAGITRSSRLRFPDIHHVDPLLDTSRYFRSSVNIPANYRPADKEDGFGSPRLASTLLESGGQRFHAILLPATPTLPPRPPRGAK